MIKVCHVTSAHESSDVRIFRKECVSLAAAGYETYLTAQGDSREEKGVHVVGVGEPPKSRVRRILFFSRKVYKKALELDADIYHLHDPELLPYALKLKRHGKKVIFDSHENYRVKIKEKSYIPRFLRTAASNAFYRYEGYVCQRLDAVAVPTTFDGANIFNGRARRTVIIANYPVLSEFFDKYRENAEKKYDICYVGALTRSRGVEQLVKAAHMAGAKLALAGNYNSESFRLSLEALSETEDVDYLGQLANERVYELLLNSRIGGNVLLNAGQYFHIDTFGVKVFEYMSMGLPVIMPKYPYVDKMIEKYKFGIAVNTDSTEEIAKAIRYLLDNEDEAHNMGLNGRRAVEQEFNWAAQEKKLLEMYERMSEEG